jgi:hypothetical protein
MLSLVGMNLYGIMTKRISWKLVDDLAVGCCFYILPQSGQPIICSTVQKLTDDERKSTEIQEALKAYDLAIETKFSHNDPP